MTIGSNDSFKLGRALSSSTSQINSSFNKLSSGKRINSASDDAAGMAIVNALGADVITSLQGARNASDGISITDMADSALSQISDITSRQGELAAQASNGTLSDDQRSTLNAEYQQLDQEKSRIMSTTQFNGVSVFSGSTIQVGTDGNSTSQIQLPGVDASAISNAADISTQAGAQSAIDSVKTSIDNLSKARGEIGSVATRVDIAENGARNNAVEFEVAASRIRDVDVADEVSKLVGAQIRQQSTVALGAQTGKLNADMVSKLLG